MRTDLRYPHIGTRIALPDGRDLAFELAVAAAVHHHHLHAVAVQRVERIALIDKDILFESLDLHIDRSVRGHLRQTLVVGQVAVSEAILPAGALLDHPFVVETIENQQRLAATIAVGTSRCGGEVFEREAVVRELAEEVDNQRCAIAVATLFLLLFHRFNSSSVSATIMPAPIGRTSSEGA